MSSLATLPELAPRRSLSLRRRLHPLLHPWERRWSALLVLGLLCGYLFFYGLGAGDLYRTESLRAIIAAEFLRSGNWIVPTLYGEPLFTKPPGMYAAIALCSLPFGQVTDWSARLPSAFAATATVFLFYWYFTRQLGLRGGFLAALILPLSILWLDKAPSAEIDMLQVAWVSGSILFFLRALEAEEDKETRRQGDRETGRQGDKETERGDCLPGCPSPCLLVSLSPCLSFPWLLLSLLCVAGGFFTKWTAPAFFYFAVVPLLWWRGRLRLFLGWPHLVGLAVAVGLCLAWVAVAVSLTGWEVFYNTVSREGLMRISPSHHHRSYPWGETLAQPFVILAANLPWSLFALLTLRRGFADGWDERGRRLLQALHCWAWPNVLFWTVIPEHAVRHSSPLFPAIVGLAALVLARATEGGADKETRRQGDKETISGFGLLVSLSPCLLVFFLSWLVVKLIFVHAVIPHRSHTRQPRAKGEQLAALVPPDTTLYLFRLKDEGIMFYYGRPVLRLPGPDQIVSPTVPMYCILTEGEWRQWDAGRPAEELGRLQDEQGDPMVLVRVGGQGP